MPVLSARSAALLAASLSLSLAPALAQISGHEWHKTYTVSGSPSLTIQTGDSSLDIQSCGDCKEIRVQVQSGRDLNDYRLEERQDGDHVSFSLKEKPHLGAFKWGTMHGPKVTVETPAHLDLDAGSADGNMTARGLRGNLQVHAGDGSVTLEDVEGALHLRTSDGNVAVRQAKGTLDARASDGRMTIDGQFSAVQLHSSDGSVDLTLAQGSQLTAPSQIESSDGSVNLRVPHTLAADLELSTSDGHLDCTLPLTMDHYDSSHLVRGRLNGGGTPLAIHTSDGNVKIEAL